MNWWFSRHHGNLSMGFARSIQGGEVEMILRETTELGCLPQNLSWRDELTLLAIV